MNKYKMTAICSLIIVFTLIMSILLPLTTVANDKESLKVHFYYANSQVKVDIDVNSEIYTGVVCKYIEVDDVLVYDDLLDQTKDNGTSLNVSQVEKDKYTTTIENVTKRYVVVYVTIGNCKVCDYIDCKPNSNKEENNEESKKENNEEHKLDVIGEPEQNPTPTPEVKPEPTTAPTPTPEVKPEPTTAPTPTPEVKPEPTTAPTPTPEVKPEPTTAPTPTPEVKPEPTKAPTPTPEVKPEPTKAPTPTPVKVIDKDTINTDDFAEIQPDNKTITDKTPDSMPKTGENDGYKILAIALFSIIAIVSFYKSKTISKKEKMIE